MPLPTIPDYSCSIRTPQLVKPTILAGGNPLTRGHNVIKYAGGFCVVFPYQTPATKYAVRCWHAEIADAKRRTQLIAEALKQSQLPYFVGFEYYEQGIMTNAGLQPIVVMDWVEALPLKKYIALHINESNVLKNLAERFKAMVSDLHSCQFSHGDLQHGNIMVRDDGSLVLVDYDSMFVPALHGMKDEIKGLQGYQHEARWNNQYATPKADYFSELVIYLSILALAHDFSLWTDLKLADTETMIFSTDDIKSKGTTPIFRRLKQNKELLPLVDKLCEFMSCQSIDDLLPLEVAVISTVDAIAGKWKSGNDHQKQYPKGKIEDSNTITSKWQGGNGYVQSSVKDNVETISAGWRK